MIFKTGAPRKVNAIGPKVEANSIGPEVEKSSKLATLGNKAVPLVLIGIAHSDLFKFLDGDFCQMFHVLPGVLAVIHVVGIVQGFSESLNRHHSSFIIRIIKEYDLFVILIFRHDEKFSKPNRNVLSMEMKYVNDVNINCNFP